MPRKKNKRKAKAHKVDVTALKRLLKTYENHCTQTQSPVSPTITRAIKKCIQTEMPYRKIILSCPETPPAETPPVLLNPLLRSIRDERYMLGTELCLWGIPLSNQDAATLAILLELTGRTFYPFCKLDAIDCQIDAWSAARLGRAIKPSQLTSITLDYNDLHDGIHGLVRGLEGNKRVVCLSLCYCNLGPESGKPLGIVLAETAVSELYLDGNHLQCSGAVDLITAIAEYAQSQFSEEKVEEATNLAHQILEGKKKKSVVIPGPWVSKLHLADNCIDAMGTEKDIGVLAFTQLLSCLIRYSEQLLELNLDDNCFGDLPATDILEALTERNKGKLPRLKMKVIAQLPSTIFKAILKESGKLKVSKKKRKKKKH